MTHLERGIAYWLLILGSALWAGLIVMAPWARAEGLALAPWLYAFFDAVCHQRPERSFHWHGEALAVCHRCFGLYLGFALGLLAMPYLHRLRTKLIASPRLILLFFAPMAIDVAVVHNTWITRFSTGLLAAVPVGLLVWMAFDELIRSRSSGPKLGERDGATT